ncbi:hypothetical protein BVC80_8843g12 [Macleaya cordata]|uniref:P-loop containing nucleoside triphosphate hydrolase n=1 Tax=Macleaya cordata TaxID=56857 RepID=A0A200PZX9_MACCD|nr:hypothetical protein BVC80_8843g12 [Macleaya cordata]
MGGGGGEAASSLYLLKVLLLSLSLPLFWFFLCCVSNAETVAHFEFAEEERLLDDNLQNPPELSSQNNDTHSDDLGVNEVDGLKFFELDDGMGNSSCLTSSDFEILWRRRCKVYQEIMQSYNNLQMRIGSLKEAKDKIISYKPGAWIEEVAGLKVSDYEVPKTTTLMLVGPRGSGKSSLVNRISRTFEDDKFRSERAQVSYNESVGDGTYFLREYMIPRGSTSFCLYDTRSLSENSCDNFEMLKNWMTDGVHHGQLVIRDSDDSCVRKNMKHKARGAGYFSGEKRMVNFVIFVVNGLSVLTSMDDKENRQYTNLLAKTFSCPYLSFKDDKPVVVITYGDLLSHSDRARIRIHLGELLGIPPDTQIFDIPETCDPSTDLTVVDMLRFSLEHADRNLPLRQWWSLNKIACFSSRY